MSNGSLSPLPPEEQFLRKENALRSYVAIIMIIVAIVVFGIVMVITIHQKHQESDDFLKQYSSPETSTLNAGNDAATNSMAPLTPPISSDTNLLN
jgi:hypothetical protein